jgi:4-hydroxy-tetrahydrodipicolinate synthase
MNLFTGVATAIVTPMNSDGSINFEKLDELIEFQISSGIDGIVICGTTGEASTLEYIEHKLAIEYTVNRVNGRVPVIAGTGSNNTSHAITMSKYAQSVGADGVLLVTPYYNKATQRGLIQHFTSIADNINIPAILYNVPGRTGVNIKPQTVLELSKHKNIVGLKEASGDISQCVEIASIIPDDFWLYSGNDDMIVPMLSIGGHGVISVLSNIAPKETVEMVSSFFEGDAKRSATLQLQSKALIDALFCEVNPIPVKEAMNMMGFEVGSVRLPLYEMEDFYKDRLRRELVNYGLLRR